MRFLAAGLAIALLTFASGARAQDAQPAPLPALPPPQSPLPPGASAGPAVIVVAAPPPAVAPAPPAAPAALPRPWQAGDPPPPGYHVEEVPLRGLLIAGYIVTGIPYGISVITALSANNNNESGWLLVPFAGPWMTMGRRNYGSCSQDNKSQTTDQSVTCVADVFVVMGLIADGTLQVIGGSLLLAGYLVTKPAIVPNEVSWHVTPMHVGTGEGAGVIGTF